MQQPAAAPQQHCCCYAAAPPSAGAAGERDAISDATDIQADRIKNITSFFGGGNN